VKIKRRAFAAKRDGQCWRYLWRRDNDFGEAWWAAEDGGGGHRGISRRASKWQRGGEYQRNGRSVLLKPHESVVAHTCRACSSFHAAVWHLKYQLGIMSVCDGRA
jgi:hypothetical protein